MRVAFDASVLHAPRPTGVERAALELLAALHELGAPGLEVVACAPRRVPERLRERLPDLPTLVLPAPAPGNLWRATLGPRWLAAHGFDLWHAPVTAFPLRARLPLAVTVQELAWLEEGVGRDAGGGPRQRLWLRAAARRAARLVCPSRRTAEQLARAHPGCARRVAVVPLGVSPGFFDPPRLAPERRRALLGSDAPFFLALGRRRRKKNLDLAVRAFHAFLRHGDPPHHLVLAGPPGNADRALRRLVLSLRLEPRVHLLDWIPEAELPAALGAASALLQLSASEGFGLPVLEAHAAGTPVVSSGRGALAEAGAAIVASRLEPDLLAGALRACAQDTAEVRAARARHRERARALGWNAAAASLRRVWEEAREAAPGR